MLTATEQMIHHFRESSTLEKTLIDNADEALYFYSIEGKLIYVNPAFEKITGYTTQELYENNFIPFIHPDDEEWTMKLWEGLFRGEFMEEIEYRIIKKNGDIRWSLSSWKIVSDRNGNQIGIQGKQQDITPRKLAEEDLQISYTKLQESHDENKQLAGSLADTNTALQNKIQSMRLLGDLIHMGKLTTMGEMATGLAHEVNQPLQAVLQSADAASLVAKDNPDDPLLLECLEDIQTYVKRAAEIVRSLRHFISRDNTKRSKVNINELAHQAVLLMNDDARTLNIDIQVVEGDIQEPFADSVQIAQVLFNFLRNSIDAISSVEKIGKNQKHLIVINTSEFANEVVVMVTDTGPGFESGIEPFKVFETSKKNGLGIGLSICRSIIESHGGRCSLDQNSTSGCRMSFTLPLAT